MKRNQNKKQDDKTKNMKEAMILKFELSLESTSVSMKHLINIWKPSPTIYNNPISLKSSTDKLTERTKR